MHDYVTWLRDSSPYINSHRERTFVVMLPGDGVAHPNFANIVHDLVLLHSLGVRLVLVFGSRPQIEARLAARGIEPRFHRDLRITDAQTLECVIDAVGQMRIALEARLSMDMAASPMQGARLRVASGNFVTARPIGVLDGVDYHHSRRGAAHRPQGYRPVARRTHHRAAVAAGLFADRGDLQPGLRGRRHTCGDRSQRRQLVLYGAEPACSTKTASWCANCARNRSRPTSSASAASIRPSCSMPPLRPAAAACGAAMWSATPTTGRCSTSCFTRDGAGTLVTQEQFEQLPRGDHRGRRRVDRSDHPAGGAGHPGAPLARGARARGRAVQHRRARRLIIACAALYPIADSDAGELACLAVNPEYRHGGRGDELLERIEERARKLGLKKLIVLTTRTAHWFRERGFEPIGVERLPAARASLYNFQRNSKIFEKSL